NASASSESGVISCSGSLFCLSRWCKRGNQLFAENPLIIGVHTMNQFARVGAQTRGFCLYSSSCPVVVPAM
ncbi:hypothetical protein GOODEAATRI_021916, partial [Goodea atripinnis]